MADKKGRFGVHGGQYIPETLMNAVIELEEAYNHFKDDPQFNKELTELLNDYAGRPSRLYYAQKMTEDLGGAKIYLKREDLNHTGAHKINNVLGQALLAKKMGKTRLIAETGAGQHGVATATAAALMGMECVVFMGEEDTVRQALNVYRMRLLGAEVIPVKSGTATLKDAVSEAMREWTRRISDTHYCLGSVMGPHPFPTIVRDFQAANLRALSGGVTTDKIFDMVRNLRKTVKIPLMFMTYANVVFSYGAEKFISTCAEIGIDGLILPDIPFEEKEEFLPVCKKYGVDLISMIAPTSNERIGMIAERAEGFIYCVSSLGVTGTRDSITADIGEMVRLVKEKNDIPCAVGFGISTPEQASSIAKKADGVIIGSAIVKMCAEYGKDCVEPVAEYVKKMKTAVSS